MYLYDITYIWLGVVNLKYKHINYNDDFTSGSKLIVHSNTEYDSLSHAAGVDTNVHCMTT